MYISKQTKTVFSAFFSYLWHILLDIEQWNFLEIIGIENVDQPDYGEVSTKLNEDDVAVFWCCGVTGVEVLKRAQLPLAFTHAPGRMFITDKLTTSESIKEKERIYGGGKLTLLSYNFIICHNCCFTWLVVDLALKVCL